MTKSVPVCESYGKKVLVIGGKKALEASYEKIESYVDNRLTLKLSAGRFTEKTVPMPLWKN